MKITLATLPQATAQQVFDQVARHLLTQNEVSKRETDYDLRFPVCLYRGSHGLKCAAGCLIADNEYNVSMEEKGWDTLRVMGEVPKEHSALIEDLQSVHDSVPPNLWKETMREYAIASLLSTEVLDENYPSNSTQSNT